MPRSVLGRFAPVSLALLGVVAAGRTFASEPTQQELLEKIDALQKKIDRIESQQAQAPTTQFSARDVDHAVDSVIRDADRRSKLLGDPGGFLGGWEDGFKIRSADGHFLWHPWVQFQFRSVTN